MGPIRIGILGAAKIAPLAVIARAHANREFEVVAVAARDGARAAAYAQKHGIAHVATDYAELVSRDDIDLIYNPLPPAGHVRWTVAALQAGKAVLCEKPFAMDAAEAREMAAAAERTGQVLIEAFHYRFHAVMRRAMQIVRSGELGRLIEADASFDGKVAYDPNELRWSAPQGGGALMDQGCYLVHFLRTLVGSEPRVVNAECAVEHGVDAGTQAQLLFADGLRARLSCSMTVENFAAQVTVKGEKGSMVIINPLAPQLGSRFTVTVGGTTRSEPTTGPSTYAAQLTHVADVLLRGASPLTGGADAVANMACIEAIYGRAGYVRTLD